MTDETREEAELELLFRSLDNDPSRTTLEAVIARAEGRPRTGWGWAAGIAAALAVSGVAWALPGSPVPEWVRSALGLEGDPISSATDEGPAGSGEAGAPAGMAFEPGDALQVIVDEGSVGMVRIALTPESRIVVQAVSGDARFTSAPNRLGVLLGQPDTLEIRIPEDAVRVVVTVGSRDVFTKIGEAVTTTLPRDPEGRWFREVGDGR